MPLKAAVMTNGDLLWCPLCHEDLANAGPDLALCARCETLFLLCKVPIPVYTLDKRDFAGQVPVHCGTVHCIAGEGVGGMAVSARQHKRK